MSSSTPAISTPIRSPLPRNPSTRSHTKSFPSSVTQDPSLLLNTLADYRNSSGKDGVAGAFDPIEFLNKHYSTEQQLVQQLPSLQDAVKTRMEALNDRISTALQKQSETADSTKRHVQDAKASVVELERRVLQVKEKAGLSERAVLEITADMKRLDCAKQHLQRTITTLKRLHMLVHAVEQLRLTSLEKPVPDYKNASHLVEAIAELLQHFETYTDKVQQMRILSMKVKDYKESLHLTLVRGFRCVVFGERKTFELEGKSISEEAEVDNPAEIRLDLTSLQGGVLFIDSLGEDERKRFVHDFCQDLLGEYVKKFEPPSPKTEKRVSSFKAAANPEPENSQSSLDHIDKRYAWFMQTPLKIVSEKFPSVFPDHWSLQASLSTMFLRLTRDHILALLDGPRKDADAESASVLLKALQKTIVFEKEITSYLERECGAKFRNNRELEEDDDDGDEEIILKPIVGVASGSFQHYMGPYIRLEEQSIGEQINEALEDRTVDTRGERPVYISSTNLFVYMKGSITRCTALTKGNAFFLLYGAFKESLKKYAQILDNKLPAATQQANNVGGIVIPFGSKQGETAATSASYRVPPNEEITVCHVVSTCEYCADTMEALEDLIRDTIDEEYKGKIDMISDQEQFHDITAKCIRVLVSGLANRLEVPFKDMAAIKWESLDAVGEESAYVLGLHESIEPFVKTVRKLLPTSYFRSFCDKFVNGFVMAYFETLVGLKRINEPGTQQLLLDLYNLKTLFLKLPVLEEVGVSGNAAGASIAPAIYTKTVQRLFGKIETILKLVGTPQNLLCDNFKVQWQGGTVADLQLIMNLKGMKRPEQVTLLEKFGYDTASALRGATAGLTSASIVSERVQQLQDQGSTVAAKVNSDLNQMRQKVDDFRKTFR